MSSFKDLLSDKNLAQLLKLKSSIGVNVGDIYKIKATEEEGITPKDGMTFRPKHFAVMGKLKDGTLYGCVVFDSEINVDYVHPDDRQFYIPIKAGSYPFITHDSYMECLELKQVKRDKLLAGIPEGKLLPEHLLEALRLVKLSSRHTHILLKIFGIVD